MAIHRNFLTVFILAALAVTLLIGGGDLKIGTAARIGPGFILLASAVGLLLVAAITARGGVALRSTHGYSDEELPPIQWRGAASIGLSVLAFGLLIQPAGLLFSSAIAVFMTSLVQGPQLPERIALAGGLATSAGLIFSVVLGLPISILPPLS